MSTKQPVEEKKELSFYQRSTSPSTWSWMEWAMVLFVVLLIGAAIYMLLGRKSKKELPKMVKTADLASVSSATPSAVKALFKAL